MNYAQVEEAERQQEEFVNAEVQGSMAKHRSTCKKKRGETRINSKKQRIPIKKNRDRDKQYVSENEDKVRLLIDCMKLVEDFHVVDF